MKEIYLSKAHAVIDMHGRGYCFDFELAGSNLLWIQEKIFIKESDFSILECHHLHYENESERDVIVFGILLNLYHVKGILLNHYVTATKAISPVIACKMKSLFGEVEKNVKNIYQYLVPN